MQPDHFTNHSIWSISPSDIKTYKPLAKGDVVDVAIIGAGITGISTAFNLVRRGLRVAVLESGQVGMGSTGSSTGNLYIPTARFNTILSKHGEKALSAVVSSRAAALGFIEERINEFSIDCSFTKVPWNYFTDNDRSIKDIEEEREAMKLTGLNISDTIPRGFRFPVKSIITVDNQAQFNPLQYVRKLASSISGENCSIYENTKVTAIAEGEPCLVETDFGVITAGKVVQATHTPKGIYAVHAMMEVYREYAIATRLRVPLSQGIYWSQADKDKYSLRTYSIGGETFLIVLGDTHKVGHKESTELSIGKIEDYARRVLGADETVYKWAAQSYSPADSLPYIGTSPLQKNVFIATGFEADGLIYGTVAGIIISDLITGRHNPWAEVFDPKRFTPQASAKKTIKENVDVLAHLIKDYVLKGTKKDFSSVNNGEGRIVEVNGKKAAAYRDDSGNLQVVSAVCPHMGCIVHWNRAERSWDCPCHGSRFAVNGRLLEGPAFNDLENALEV